MTPGTTTALGDLIEVKHGFAFEGRFFADEGPFRLLTPGNFAEEGGFLDRGDKQKHYDGPVPPEFILRPGSVLVAMTEQAEGLLGSTAVVPDGKPCLHNQRLGLIRPRPGVEVNLRFIYYLFNTPSVRAQIRATATGTKVRHTSPSRIHAVQAFIPTYRVQERIASILGAYDDLIEVNRRRIALLEEMARRLFEEWFVHLRFPGHEGVSCAPSGEVQLPHGWSMQRLGDLTSILTRGVAPKYDEAASTLVINQKCIRGQRLSLAPARRQSRPAPSEKLVKPGDVLINSTGVGTLGRTAQAEEVPPGLTVDTHVTMIRPLVELDRDYFGMALLRLEPLFERLGIGATGQTELNRSRIAEVEIAVPPRDLQAAFGRHARPLRFMAFTLGRQNERLAASRDLLLPRLISGELSVAAAECELEAAA